MAETATKATVTDNEDVLKPYVIGLDLGGTNSVFGIVDTRGSLRLPQLSRPRCIRT